MAYNNTMKIEFYKPKYNLDIKFDGDDSFDLLFKNVSGEFFFSASVEDYDSYVSFEDEECKFTNGELVAKVDISDLMETIANGQLRNTNGTTYGEWIPRIVGDYKTEHDLIFDGKTYADRGYWELFFKEMSKDEIKDFIEFCRDYIDIPNLEFSFREFDFNNDNIVVNGNGYSITINDDLTIEMAEEFTCKSLDAIGVWEMNHDYGDEFEEKKSIRKSLKESVEFDYDNHSGVFFAYVDGSDLSIAYAPRKYEDLSGWDISKDGVPIVYDVWEDKSDEYVLNSIKEFEKQLKKYFDTADVKIIMKDFHEKVGKYI